jgi:hypothetical protein
LLRLQIRDFLRRRRSDEGFRSLFVMVQRRC